MRLTAIPYRADSAELFEAIADEPWSVFLDSGQPNTHTGRFDILAARPFITLVTRGGSTEIRQSGTVKNSTDDPFALLRETLAADARPTPLPFAGGAIGYFGYDLARRIERLPSHAHHDQADSIPDMAVGIYDWAVVVDHAQRASWLVGAGRDAETAASWQTLVALFSSHLPPPERPAFRVGPVTCNFTPDAYRAAFARIQRYIHAGDCYQVNLAQRFAAPASGDRRIRPISTSPARAFCRPRRSVSWRSGGASWKPNRSRAHARALRRPQPMPRWRRNYRAARRIAPRT